MESVPCWLAGSYSSSRPSSEASASAVSSVSVVSAPDTALFRASPAKSSGNGFSKIRFFSDEKSHALYPHALRRGSLLFQ